jgi:TolA-binding protein
MTRRLLDAVALALGLCSALSCSVPGSLQSDALSPPAAAARAALAADPRRGAPLPALLPPPAPAAAAGAMPAAPAPPPAPAAAEPANVRLGTGGPAITETLGQAMEMLAQARADNERLKETVATLQGTLEEKENALKTLADQLQQCEARTSGLEQSLEKWKQDVLGFRDEMRDCQEAEIQVLQEMLALLKGLKKEAALRPEGAGGNP